MPDRTATPSLPRVVPGRDQRRAPGELQGLPPDPQHLGPAGARTGRPASRASGWPTPCGPRASSTSRSRRPAFTRSSTPTGSTPRALRPSSSTATTTSSRSTRSTCGPRRRSSRSWPTAGCSPAARRTTRARSTPMRWPPRPSWPPAARFPINVKYVFEGRGELARSASRPGSWPTSDRLAADVAIISDTGFFEGNIPAITVSLRGLMYAQIDVVGSEVDLHSGGYGGAVQNPANALAQILAALKGPDGRIRIPGFYDDGRRPDRGRASADRGAPVRRGRVREASHVRAWSARSATRRSSAAPRAPRSTSTGMWGGFQGDGRQDDHPGPCPRQGQLPARRRPGPRRHLREVPRLRRSRSRLPA